MATDEGAKAPRMILTPGEAADYLGISMNQLFKLVSTRQIPQYKFGRHIRFLCSDLDKWGRGQVA